MSGIISWGVAIPRRSLANEITQMAWDRPAIPGARRIAAHDEDSITLGVEAALQSLNGVDPQSIDAVIFATTTPPFLDKSSATIVAEVLNITENATCLDLNSSLRAGTKAISSAMHLIDAGRAKSVLVISADTRAAKPGSIDENFCGHAAAAVIINSQNDSPVEIESEVQQNASLMDSWRSEDSSYHTNGDIRFARLGYQKVMSSVIEKILRKENRSPANFAKVITFSPDAKAGMTLLKKAGFNTKTQYTDLVSFKAGVTGTAHSLLMLIAAIESSQKGDLLLSINHGDGADAFTFKVTQTPTSNFFKESIQQKFDISYNHYLKIREQFKERSDDNKNQAHYFNSPMMEKRNSQLWQNLIAKRCEKCETVITLPINTCPNCKQTISIQPFALTRRGSVFAITFEHYFPTPEPPLGMAVINLQGGGRLTLQVADPSEKIKIGDEVELVYRKLHHAGNRAQYFWKCRIVTKNKEAQ